MALFASVWTSSPESGLCEELAVEGDQLLPTKDVFSVASSQSVEFRDGPACQSRNYVGESYHNSE
jgi:hypothetical protein